jgi:hypothetical protein
MLPQTSKQVEFDDWAAWNSNEIDFAIRPENEIDFTIRRENEIDFTIRRDIDFPSEGEIDFTLQRGNSPTSWAEGFRESPFGRLGFVMTGGVIHEVAKSSGDWPRRRVTGRAADSHVNYRAPRPQCRPCRRSARRVDFRRNSTSAKVRTASPLSASTM